MPVLLQYDFRVVGLQRVQSAISSIEKRYEQSAARMARASGMSPSQARSRARGAVSPQAAAFSQIAGAAKFAKAEQRLQEQTARKAQSLEDKRHRARLAHQKAEFAAERREAMRASRAREQYRRATVGRAFDSVKSSVGGVGRAGLAATGLAGGAVIATQLASGVSLEKRQMQVIRNATGAGQKAPVEYGALRSGVSAASISTGASQEDITSGIEAFVQKTGDIETATKNMQNFATVAVATGASVEDIASAAADLSQKFGIKEASAMGDALAVLAFQGKKGAFELKDIAANFPEMAAAAQRAGMTGVGGMKTLGGLAQIARSGTGSGAEASTAVQMMMTQLVHEAPKLQSGESLGGKKVNVFEGGDATKPMRDVREVLADVISQSGGNLSQLQDVFDVRGIRAASPMISRYRETVGATKGTATEKQAAGRKAILDMIADASDAGGEFADVQRDAAAMLGATSAQLEILNTKLSAAVNSELLPALTRLIPELTKLVPYLAQAAAELAKFVGWFAANPLSGIGAVVLGKIGADLAVAGIGAAVRGMLVQSIAGAAAGSVGARAAGALAGGMSAASGGAAVAGGGLLAGIGGAARGGLAGAAAGAGALGAGALAVGGVAAAGYQAYQLISENSNNEGIWEGLKNAWKDSPSQPSTPEQYDQQMKASEAQQLAAKQQTEAATALLKAAESLKASTPMAGTGTPQRSNDPTKPRI